MSVHSEIAYEITEVLRRELTGRDCGDLLHYANVERVFPVGCIFPEPKDGETRRPTSCGLTVQTVNSTISEASVRISGHFYIRRQPTLAEQLEHLSRHWNADLDEVRALLASRRRITLAYCWKYVPFNITITIDKDNGSQTIDLTDALVQAWTTISNDVKAVPCNKMGWRTKLTEAPGRSWEAEEDFQDWIRQEFRDQGPAPDEYPTHVLHAQTQWCNGQLRITLVNRSALSSGGERRDWLLDQAFYSLELEIPDADRLGVVSLKKTVRDTFDAIKTTQSWGEGRNLHVTYEDGKILGRPICIFRSQRIAPVDQIEGIDLSFKALSEGGVEAAETVVRYLRETKNEYEKLRDQCEEGQFGNAIGKLDSIIERMGSGIELMKNDHNMKEAFCLMNETFLRRYTCDERMKSWRLFQFTYIISKLASIVHPEEDTCDVIYVTTGGGKTETYFGLMITAMFYHRLIGRYTGTIAIVKFPFRMLAIDQIQRIAPLIAIADMVRSEHPRIGKFENLPQWMYEFSLGFMIGESSGRATPNRVNADPPWTESEDIPSEKIDLRTILAEHPEEVKLFFECPVCRYNNHMNGHSCEEQKDTVENYYDESEIRGRHECSVCGSRFAVHWTDEECFRYLPTIIVSTQDRIAYPAFAPHARALFGAPIYYCPNHGFSIYSDSCTAFKGPGGYGKKHGDCSYLKKNKRLSPMLLEAKDRGLRYVIQDEMHLLRSDLGALNAPFERMVSQTVKRYCGFEPQRIGMSATVQGVDTQVKELYGNSKTLWLFPGDPPIPVDASGSEPDAFFMNSRDLHRVVLGCMPSIEDPSVLVQRAIDRTTLAVRRWEQRCASCSTKDLPPKLGRFDSQELADGLRQYRVVLGFMNTKVDLERSKQNIENITNIERRKAAKFTTDAPNELEVAELTGDDTIMRIREIIAKIKNCSEVNPRDKIDVLFATSLVSHGIDLPSMNLMVFYGLPGSTSEYVQALSRVGRRTPGVTLLAYHPNRARDRGLWRTFGQYHQALRQQVEIMPVDHYAPGLLDQTFVTLLRCYWNLIAEVDLNSTCTNTKRLYTVEQIVDANDRNGKEITFDACEMILKWYEWDESELGRLSSKAGSYMEALRTYYHEVKNKKHPVNLKALSPPPMYAELRRRIQDRAEPWMTTMTGIRGIQEGLGQYCDQFSETYLKTGARL